VSAPGVLLFARYAYPPNELGYCGPDGAATMLRAEEYAEIARRARRFEGAWSYLEFIARAAGVADPLDEAVVEAYWVGNDLLDQVDPDALVCWLRDRFAGQDGGTWQTAGGRATAHHSFQVFEVYPWAAMLRRNQSPVALSVLDRCRIRTGVVVRVDAETATVRSRRLRWDGGALGAGPEVEEVVRWSRNGRSLIDEPVPGDRVSLHWDWICDIVSDQQAARLESLTARQHDAVFEPR